MQLHGTSYDLEESVDGEINSRFSMRNGLGAVFPLRRRKRAEIPSQPFSFGVTAHLGCRQDGR